MTQRKIAGIDYSLTSPAICIYTEKENDRFFDFDRCMLYYLSNNERQQQLAARSGIGNIRAEPYPKWNTQEERYDALSSWVILLIKGCSEIYLEGYAYGVTSNRASIYENTSILKHKMWKQKLTFTNYPPTTIKKFATGKGNANKEQMYEAFVNDLLTPTDLKEQLTPKANKVISPISDIVDSYFIAKCGVEGVL